MEYKYGVMDGIHVWRLKAMCVGINDLGSISVQSFEPKVFGIQVWRCRTKVWAMGQPGSNLDRCDLLDCLDVCISACLYVRHLHAWMIDVRMLGSSEICE